MTARESLVLYNPLTTLWAHLKGGRGKERPIHRVNRVPGFFFSRPNWDTLTPSPEGECVPLWFRGAEILACGRGGGGSQFGRGDRHRGTLGINILSGPIEGVRTLYIVGHRGGGGLEPKTTRKAWV